MNLFSKVKDHVSLLDYASQFVRLNKKGSSYLGLCPFHSEKTASFSLDAEKGLFHCFGCGACGDLFDFYSLYHSVSKKEALYSLCAYAGIDIAFEKKTDKNDLATLNSFFSNSSKHFEFLEFRGVQKEVAVKFKLGWAPDKKQILDYIYDNKLNLKAYGFDDYFWTMFENRIVFPIFDAVGSVCSFGGRALDSRSKYINGPASSFFDKSSLLYGINFLRHKKEIYLVEGYLDVIALYQAGFDSLASLGTSFTSKQLSIAWGKNENLVVAMDADAAGLKSSKKIASFALEQIDVGKKISFLYWPDGDDAASYLQKNNDIMVLRRDLLHEFLFRVNEKMSNPDDAAIFLSELMKMANEIGNIALRSQYKKYWRDLWWNFGKAKKVFKVELPNLQKDRNVLLLFKYVLMYPAILEEVDEYFLKLVANNQYFSKVLMDLIEGKEIDSKFKQQAMGLISEEIRDNLEALRAWKEVALLLERRKSYDKLELSVSLKNNFCQEEWERLKSILSLEENNHE